MACKKDIEAGGGVQKWLSKLYNEFTKGKGKFEAPVCIIMGQDLFQHYEGSLDFLQMWVPSKDGTVLDSEAPPIKSLAFKASKCYMSKKPGWALTIVGPYGILEA